MQADLALRFDPARGGADLVYTGSGLLLDLTPASALVASLGSDRRARPDDALPWDDLPGAPEVPAVVPPAPRLARSSIATWVDAAGVLRKALVNEARYAPDGTLILEAASTNLLRWSEALDNPVWGKSANLQVTPNAAQAPDGTMTADRLTTTASSAGFANQALTIEAGGQYGLSWHLKPGTQNWCIIQLSTVAQDAGFRGWFDLARRVAGRQVPLGPGLIAETTVEPLADGWARVSVRGTVDASTTSVRAWITPAAGDFTVAQVIGGTLYAWGAMCEPGAVSSYIPATDKPAPRAPDVLLPAAPPSAPAAAAPVATGLTARRGWAGDALDRRGERTGSRLWLLARAKDTEQTRRLAEGYAAEAIAWLARRGLAPQATATRIRPRALQITAAAGRSRLTIQRALS